VCKTEKLIVTASLYALFVLFLITTTNDPSDTPAINTLYAPCVPPDAIEQIMLSLALTWLFVTVNTA
jgi:hypothetical protein